MPNRPSPDDRVSRFPDTVVRLTDALIFLLIALVVAIVVTDGWQLELSGRTVSMRSIGNLLVAAALLTGARLLRPHTPILWSHDTTVATLADRALASAQRAHAWLASLDRRGAIRLLAGMMGVATAIRLFNIIMHFGFITGDDVEIHEMTLALVLGRDWPVWELRSPFYPMTFVYPAQRAMATFGVTNVFALIAAGRLVVSLIAALNIALTYRAGRILRWSRGQALLAASLFALNHLHMNYGSAELPRVVATSFMLGAFCLLRRSGWWPPVVAGMSLAVGACLRFGEIVFVVPALATLAWWPPSTPPDGPPNRRVFSTAVAARVVLFSIAAVVTAAFALGLSDALYWGEPFHSLRAIVDYTLVKKLSSRGYEPFVYYFTHLSNWSNVLLVLLALLGLRVGGALPLLWALLPIALLSLLPHKEPRYVIATIPFFALAASRTLSDWLERLAAPQVWRHPSRAPIAALCLLLSLAGAALFDASKFRFHRSEDQVRLAWTMAGSGQHGIAAEQLWRFGGQLYLADSGPLIDLDPSLADEDLTLRQALCREDVHWAALQRDRLSAGRRSLLNACGFAPASAIDRSGRYFVYRKLAGRVAPPARSQP